MNSQASRKTLITLPIKVAGEVFTPFNKGLKNRISSMTIGNSINITSIDCFQLLGTRYSRRWLETIRKTSLADGDAPTIVQVRRAGGAILAARRN